MDLTSIVEDIEWTKFRPQMDGQKDGQTDQYEVGGYNETILILSVFLIIRISC